MSVRKISLQVSRSIFKAPLRSTLYELRLHAAHATSLLPVQPAGSRTRPSAALSPAPVPATVNLSADEVLVLNGCLYQAVLGPKSRVFSPLGDTHGEVTCGLACGPAVPDATVSSPFCV